MADRKKPRKQTPATRDGEIRVDMLRSIVTMPLLSEVHADREGRFDVIISLNELYKEGIAGALKLVEAVASDWKVKYRTVSHYCFACLTGDQVLFLAEDARQRIAAGGMKESVIYRIWKDDDVAVSMTKSLTTVKADAAQRAFHALGDGIVWAVLDSGVEAAHPHFRNSGGRYGAFDSTDLTGLAPLTHLDFTPFGDNAKGTATTDKFGHGTHVAGIIAGHWESTQPGGEAVAGAEMRNESTNEPVRFRDRIQGVTGVAPRTKVLSMKVIADETLKDGDVRQTAGQGKVSWVLLALDQIMQWNQYGKRMLVHGANLSLGYEFDPRWFACGQSPVCVEVNRLVKTGVSVVVSAGNSGYSMWLMASGKAEARFADLSITDPGNAELAVTVGATHGEAPHRYGVSYFSSRGPTGDGRMKPDLVAPGERIVSCASGVEQSKYGLDEAGTPVLYCEQSGTSMAAPHVSGAIAAFLSVRPEFIGQPERVKEVLLSSTIDLRRDRTFQGAGLLDLMKMLQAV